MVCRVSQCDMSICFEVNAGLRKGCRTTPWLCDIRMAGAVGQVYGPKQETVLSFSDPSQQTLVDYLVLWVDSPPPPRYSGSQLMFVDDLVLWDESTSPLRSFGRVCERNMLTAVVYDGRLMVMGRKVSQRESKWIWKMKYLRRWAP